MTPTELVISIIVGVSIGECLAAFLIGFLGLRKR